MTVYARGDNPFVEKGKLRIIGEGCQWLGWCPWEEAWVWVPEGKGWLRQCVNGWGVVREEEQRYDTDAIVCRGDDGGLWKFLNEFRYWKKQPTETGWRRSEVLKVWKEHRVDMREGKSSHFGACLPECESWLGTRWLCDCVTLGKLFYHFVFHFLHLLIRHNHRKVAVRIKWVNAYKST